MQILSNLYHGKKNVTAKTGGGYNGCDRQKKEKNTADRSGFY